MKDSARLQTVTEILDLVYANNRVPMSTVIGDFMRGRRYIGSKDRAAMAEMLYDIMRAHARLGWWIKKTGLPVLPRSRVILWGVLAGGHTPDHLGSLYNGAKYAPTPLSAEEKAVLETCRGEKLIHPDMPDHTAYECPEELAPALKNLWGDDFKEELAAMLVPATLDLRVNVFLRSMQEVQEALAKDGVKTDETPYSPIGLRCRDKAYLAKTKAFAKGWIEIQDEGSQMITLLCEVEPGMQVLDFCAGAGGKTLALAAIMQRKGRIVAMDNDDRRLEKGRQRYKKSGLADIIEVRYLNDTKNRKWLRRQKEKFDVVLLDVPCSGTGTWRRNPDMRWAGYGPDLEELKTAQQEILARAAPAVKPGGHLVYATCSLLHDENEAQIEAFLKDHTDFEVVPTEREDIGTPFMRLSPYRNDTDGFFAARLQRRLP